MTRATTFTALAASVAVIAACHSGRESMQPALQPPVPVATTRVVLVEIPDRLEAGGVVTAERSAILSSRIVAPVESVGVKAGDVVRKGDVLVTLDDRDIVDRARQASAAALAADKALAQARSQASAARAEQMLAAAWQSRIAQLRARESATAQEKDEADARLDIASARVAAATASIEQAEAALAAARAGADGATAVQSFAVLRAPFDGIVTERLIDPGSLATPGIPLIRLDSSGARRVEVRVDEARAAYIHPGDEVDVAIDHSRVAEAADRSSAVSRVVEVARAASADQHAFTVKVALPDARDVRTGTFGRVWFRGPTRRVLVVPASAVRRQGQVSSVLVVEGGIARLRLVQTGEPAREGETVLAGLDAGELIVTAWTPTLNDGHRVVARAPSGETGGPR